MVSKKVFYR